MHAPYLSYKKYLINSLIKNPKLISLQTCEESFESCVDGKNPITEIDKVNAFRECVDPEKFEALNNCTENCSLTLKMLKKSEWNDFNNIYRDNGSNGPDEFPEIPTNTVTQPSTSIC